MSEIILMSDARVAAVPVEECGEALVDVRASLRVDDRKHKDSHGAEVHLRQGVLDRLLRAEALLPQGLRLLFVEGYRPPPCSGPISRGTSTNCAPITRTGPPMASARRPAAMCPRPRSPRTRRAPPWT